MGGLVPSKGWKARQPETGTVVEGLNKTELISKVRSYREANNLPVPANLVRMVEDQICETMSEAEAARRCYFLSPDDSTNPPELRDWRSGRNALLDFGKAALAVLEAGLAGKDAHVGRDESARRSAVCAQCRYNVPIAACFGCGELGSIYRKLCSGLSTPHDGLLQSCDRCGCGNRAQVHLTGEVLRTVAGKQGLTADVFPDWCWKKKVLTEGGETNG
mgnify:CR=1 FL=1